MNPIKTHPIKTGGRRNVDSFGSNGAISKENKKRSRTFQITELNDNNLHSLHRQILFWIIKASHNKPVCCFEHQTCYHVKKIWENIEILIRYLRFQLKAFI
jgi:hypothetical protein